MCTTPVQKVRNSSYCVLHEQSDVCMYPFSVSRLREWRYDLKGIMFCNTCKNTKKERYFPYAWYTFIYADISRLASLHTFSLMDPHHWRESIRNLQLKYKKSLQVSFGFAAVSRSNALPQNACLKGWSNFWTCRQIVNFIKSKPVKYKYFV